MEFLHHIKLTDWWDKAKYSATCQSNCAMMMMTMHIQLHSSECWPQWVAIWVKYTFLSIKLLPSAAKETLLRVPIQNNHRMMRQNYSYHITKFVHSPSGWSVPEGNLNYSCHHKYIVSFQKLDDKCAHRDGQGKVNPLIPNSHSKSRTQSHLITWL